MIDPDDSGGRDDPRGGLTDSIRKALLTGLSAVFMTEEGIRNVLSDMRLPKEALGYIAQQTDRTRRELFRAVNQEIKNFLKGVDWNREVRKALVGLKVEVKAIVRFREDERATPEISVRLRDSGAPPERRKRR
ncbi:MAG: hypothetical protein HYZ27_07095 [Deltaproteobacteria bacterium]|nr:hypothetical protein [Deltaproteobacteria bacterium]